MIEKGNPYHFAKSTNNSVFNDFVAVYGDKCRPSPLSANLVLDPEYISFAPDECQNCNRDAKDL